MSKKRKFKQTKKPIRKDASSPLPPVTRSAKSDDLRTDKGLVAIEHHFSSGPLPQPDVLSRYNEIVPGAAERIIAMAENQSRHRQELEAKAVSAQVEDDRAQRTETFRGQVFGFLIAIVAIAGGVLSVCLVPGVAGGVTGSIIGGGGVASLVYAFRYGRKQESGKQEK